MAQILTEEAAEQRTARLDDAHFCSSLLQHQISSVLNKRATVGCFSYHRMPYVTANHVDAVETKSLPLGDVEFKRLKDQIRCRLYH
ncbi:hypothetical protein TNCV_5122081 [Trichonephila clavipes]|nr:hypothetical protein TNCV_5122081 [Trichonephila clavipes]